MRIIVSEYGEGFNLIAENNYDKAFLRNLWDKQVSKKKEKKHPFSICLYGHLYDQTEHWEKTPFQMDISIHKNSSHAEEWQPRDEK